MNTKTRHHYIQLLSFATFAKGNSYVIADDFLKLQKLARKLSAIDTKECNGEYTEETTAEILRNVTYKKIDAILKPLRASWYHQCDPRGASLYISRDYTLNQENYTNGIAIY